MRIRPALLIAAALLAGGCAEFPELDAAVPRSVAEGPFPRLLPMEELTGAPAPTVGPEAAEELTARADALRARAERLRRRSVDDPAEG